VNTLGLHAAHAALGDDAYVARESARNAEVRRFVAEKFTSAGCDVPVSHTNFLMIDMKRDTGAFRSGCQASDVRIGRRFATLDTRVRISLGTLEEMERAWDVFAPLLSA